MTSSKPPTYGDLLTILESAERQALEGGDRSTAELLTVELHHKFPHIQISRPGHRCTIRSDIHTKTAKLKKILRLPKARVKKDVKAEVATKKWL